MTTHDNLTIRQATADDAPAVRALLQSVTGVWQSNWRGDAVERAIASAAGLAFVAQRDDAIIGFACAHDTGFRAYLSELAVAESDQRTGIGTRLLNAIENALAARGCAILIADVYPPAAEFYRKLGWSEPDAVLMRKRC